jgi:hypothetical protein
VLEDVVPVLGGKVGAVQGDAEVVGDRLRVGVVGFGGAVLGAVILIPVLHEQTLDVVALLEEEQGRDRGIDAAGHADDYGGTLL